MPDDILYSYGWRLPFLASFVLFLVAMFVRRMVNESPEFTESLEKDKEKVKAPVKEVLTKVPKLLLLTIGANVIGIAGFYFTNTFMLAYTTSFLSMPRGVVLDALFLVAIGQFLTMPIFALIAERVGVHLFLVISSGLCIIFPYAMFSMVDTGSVIMITLGVGLCHWTLSGCYANIAGFVTSLYPPRMRYSGISMAYQFSGAIFGAITPLIGTALAQKYSGDWMPLAIFFSVISFITMASFLGLNPKRNTTY